MNQHPTMSIDDKILINQLALGIMDMAAQPPVLGRKPHSIRPTPPQTAANGLSTVLTANEIYTAGGGHPDGPYG
jgi:hypothetical protein